MTSKGFLITFPGDESVGIFSQEWKLTGEFEFEDNDHLEEVRDQIRCFFATITSENTHVETFEEIQAAEDNLK